MSAPPTARAVAALLVGAATWGVIWYPYRLLHERGLGGIAATTLTYLVALVLGSIVLRRHLHALRPTPMLIAIGLAAGGCNLGYVLATIHGEVMRVLLLFYLAPLWTVLLSGALLGERLNATGGAIVAVSLSGALTMLWHPEFGAPWPRAGAEWIGLAAGFLFALSNVLIRKAGELTIEVKSLAVCVGAVVLGGGLLAAGVEVLPAAADGRALAFVAGIGAVLIAVNLVVQYGLMRVAANQAIVILLSELVFAAIAAWLLTGERMGSRDWIGGGLIVAASLLAARMERDADAQRRSPT